MSISLVAVLVPLLAVAALGWFIYWMLLSPGAGPRRWMRLRHLRRVREERLIRRAAERDRG